MATPFIIKKGLSSALASQSIVAGTIYFCTDTGEMYVGIADGEKTKITDLNLLNKITELDEELSNFITTTSSNFESQQIEIDSKVDKIEGKGLSTNDYTTNEKNKLAGIATGATANTGTITAVQVNGTSVATSGTANIPAASTSAYGVTKLSSSTSSTSTSLAATASAVRSAYNLANTANIAVANITPIIAQNKSPTWTLQSTPTYTDFPYRGSVSITGVTANMIPEVIFGLTEAMSGNYAPVAETYAGGVYIYSKVSTTITIPTIICHPKGSS